MGCNCGSKSKLARRVAPVFKVRWPDGITKVFRTEAQAKAEMGKKPGGQLTTTK